MIEVRETGVFVTWLSGLRDRRAIARINIRIRRLEMGNPGDAKSVGDGVYEMRVDYGPGYRVYYVHMGKAVVILLCGGDKSTQDHDIKAAKSIANQL
ncbi:MAG: type II toxin-antitoxin system RelE/ParE family toxin [Roseiarcus sp.]|jgi:putative addiction module killer protein